MNRNTISENSTAKASIQTIMRAGRWKQVNTVMEYIEANAQFEDSAAADVLNHMKNEIE